MKKWAMATAVYGEEAHLKFMREGWEPMTVTPIQQQNSISREIEVSFIVFLKREATDEQKPEPTASERSGLIGV